MKNIFYVLILLLFLACKENTKEVLSVPTIKLVNGSSIDYFVSFPDTVFVKEVYKGKVYYKSDLDTITTSFDDTEKERYTILYLKLLPKYVYDDFEFENFKKTAKLKYGADDNTKITFNNIRFDSVGTYYINGVIRDFVYIDLHQKNENGEDMLRLIEKQEEILYKVVVVQKPISNKFK